MSTYKIFQEWVHEKFIVDSCYLKNGMVFLSYHNTNRDTYHVGLSYKDSLDTLTWMKATCEECINLRRKV